MTEWIVPCKLKYYRVDDAFGKLDRINWKQAVTKIRVGDIVYIYVCSPIKEIKYKCIVNKVNLDAVEIDDGEFVVDGTPYANYGRYMELELLKTYAEKMLSLEELKNHGFKGNVQGQQRLKEQVIEFINSAE